MSSIEFGEVGRVVVESTLTDPISAGASGVHSLVARNWRAITLSVEVVSQITDTKLCYVDHGSRWSQPLEVSPFISGTPPNSKKVAALRHDRTGCPDGQSHTVHVDATAHRIPVGPREPVGGGPHDTSC
jgi:hypothetical protein